MSWTTVGEMPTSRASSRMDFPSRSMRPWMTSDRRNDRYLLSNFRRRFGFFMIRSNVVGGLFCFIVGPFLHSRFKVILGTKSSVLLAGWELVAFLDKTVCDDDLPPRGEETKES